MQPDLAGFGAFDAAKDLYLKAVCEPFERSRK